LTDDLAAQLVALKIIEVVRRGVREGAPTPAAMTLKEFTASSYPHRPEPSGRWV
jgi:hypothetical protein